MEVASRMRMAGTLSDQAQASDLVPHLDIDGDRCKGCSLCVTTCTRHALALDVRVVNRLGYHPVRLVDVRACTSCVLCARICPEAVFTVYAPLKGG
jgi:2-oxoglutarate ferredoxin oxidoreductase subunit delta